MPRIPHTECKVLGWGPLYRFPMIPSMQPGDQAGSIFYVTNQ